MKNNIKSKCLSFSMPKATKTSLSNMCMSNTTTTKKRSIRLPKLIADEAALRVVSSSGGEGDASSASSSSSVVSNRRLDKRSRSLSTTTYQSTLSKSDSVGSSTSHRSTRSSLSKYSTTPSSSPSTHRQTRNRYLERLGVTQHFVTKSANAMYTTCNSSMTATRNATSSQQQHNIHYEALKGDHGKEHKPCIPSSKTSKSNQRSWFLPSSSPISVIPNNEDITPASTPSSSFSSIKSTASSSKPKKSCSFHESVSILPIPKRETYSNRMKQQLWVNSQEIMNGVQRNTLEFASENWDVQQVLEDEDFYVCVETGEKVHPIHARLFELEQQQRQYEQQMMEVQQQQQMMQQQKEMYSLSAQYHEQDELNSCASMSRNKDSFLEISQRAAMEWQSR